MPKSIEEKYRKLTDIEHVLLRPGMYVGSIALHEENVHLLGADGRFGKEEVTFNPAFLKIFDEILSNAADEHRRSPKLNLIKVTVDAAAGKITVRDNGGIPVRKNKDHDEWVPEMIFSNLKAGSNFDDSEARLVAGTNGVGATLTNIYSTKFVIRTCDKKNLFEQVFKKNMTERQEPVIKEGSRGFTEVIFEPDLPRFSLPSIDEVHVELMRKRCADIAACNPKLRVVFNGEDFKFPSFQDYCKLYVDELIYEESKHWKVGVTASSGSFEQTSFVNAVETRDGGTHVDALAWQLISWLRAKIKKKHKVDLKPQELKNHFRLFVQCDIENPAFSSQTKEKMITDPKIFGSRFEFTEKTLKSILASEVVQRVLDWAQQKDLAEERKKLRQLNKKVSKAKVVKLIDAKARSGRVRCTLALFEGDSASSAFRMFRDPMTQGAFPLRGKFINVTGLANTRVMQNREVQDLLAAIGLKMGEEPTGLRYGKILIYADADPDGDSITGLLVNFFARYWPELFEKRRIYRVMTPLVVVEKSGVKKIFYTNEDFEAWTSATNELKKWDISYKKGLAALESEEYLEIIQNPKMFALIPGKNMADTLRHWFAKDPSHRKVKILGGDEDEIEDEDDMEEPEIETEVQP